MSLKKKLRGIAKKASYKEFGATCYFFPLPKERGLKLYPVKREAEKTHRLQSLAAAYGLAPPIHTGIVKLYRECWNDFGWGYVTSLAKLAGQLWAARYDEDFFKAEKELREGLRATGFDANDMHAWNWGMFNGRPVCIDFSHFGGNRDA